ncbi:inhibitor of KinA [Bacillus oleivorans]|uniref:Inhibitor of KinA n=1 Tax=Bacillus oleivorans TaxID=1448271 RepID=A0A285CLZ3_9BACI|nr:5-oxoprolinase subunit PxpB [Bacillus oleivorans]SNX68425.1 inhibitor of KinA [Bacillus oleivorans]
MTYTIEPLGDEALIISFLPADNPNIHKKARIFAETIKENPFVGFIEEVCSYHTVTLYFIPQFEKGNGPLCYIKNHIEQILATLSSIQKNQNHRKLQVPVCYDPRVGPDLESLAEQLGYSVEDVIQLHSSPLYEVRFIGFSPGFPFFSGLDQRLAFPRKATPRLKIAPGSVGIAGKQTGIYSLETPGGWNIIGKTPIELFNSKSPSPAFFRPGDLVKLIPLRFDEFIDWKGSRWQFEY